MNNKKLHKSFSTLMLVIMVAQILVPTVYNASEVSDQIDVKVASFENFTKVENNQYVLDFNSEKEVNLSFDYDLNIEDYNFFFNEKQLDINQTTTTRVGNNEMVIEKLAADASDIIMFNVMIKNEDKDAIELVEQPFSSELTSTAVSEEAKSEESSEIASEEPSEVASEEPSEVASEEPSEIASEEPSEVASEEPSEVVSEDTAEPDNSNAKDARVDPAPYSTVPGIRASGETEYVDMNLQEFWNNTKVDGVVDMLMIGDGDDTPYGPTISFLNRDRSYDYCESLGYSSNSDKKNCDEGKVGSITTNFSLSTAYDFSLDTNIYIQEDDYGGIFGATAADSFGLLFTGNENPYATGNIGNAYGVEGLTDTLAIVIDYYANKKEHSALTTATTDSSGAMSKGWEHEDENNSLNSKGTYYEVKKKENFNRYDIQMDYTAASNQLVVTVDTMDYNGKTGVWESINQDTTTNFLNNTVAFTPGDSYPIKLAASEGGSRSEIRIPKLHLSGYVSYDAEIQNTTNPVTMTEDGSGGYIDSSFVEFGVPQTMEIYTTNNSSSNQDITYDSWVKGNYQEKGTSFTEQEEAEADSTLYSEQLTDNAWVNNITGNQKSTVTVDMTPVDPSELTKAQQLEYLKDPNYIEATFGTTLHYGAYAGESVAIDVKQNISGSDATIDSEDTYFTTQALDETTIENWLLTQVDVNDPYVDELEATDFAAVNGDTSIDGSINERIKWSDWTVVDDTATVTLSVRGLNNVWVNKPLTVIHGEEPVDPTVAHNLRVNVVAKDMSGDGYVQPGETVTYTILIDAIDSTESEMNLSIATEPATFDGSYLSDLSVTGATNIGTVVADTSGLVDTDPGIGYAGAFTEFPANAAVKLELSGTAVTSFSIPDSDYDLTQDFVVTSDYYTLDQTDDRLDWVVTTEIPLDAGIYTAPFKLSKEFVSAYNGGNYAREDDRLNYIITLENNALLRTDVTLKDTPDSDDTKGTFSVIPTVKRNGSLLSSGSDYTYNASTAEVTINTINPNDVITVEYSVDTVSSFADMTPITNTVIASSGPTLIDTASASAPKYDDSVHKLAINKKVSDANTNGLAEDGEVLTYTIDVTNPGVAETGVTITDVFDTNIDPTSIAITATDVTGGATVTSSDYAQATGLKVVADMPADSTLKITVTGVVDLSSISKLFARLIEGTISNTAVVTSDDMAGFRQASVEIPFNIKTEDMGTIVVTKELVSTLDGDMLADSNEILNFKATIENTGTEEKTNVVLTDTYTGDFVDGFVLGTVELDGTPISEGTDYTVDGDTLTVNEIPAGSTLTIEYSMVTVLFTDAAPLVNTMTATSLDADGSSFDDVTVDKDLVPVVGVDPVIVANDAQVNLADAPTNETELIELMNAHAFDADGKNITSDITVVNLGGYNFGIPAEGDYNITFAVVGDSSKPVSKTVILHVLNDTAVDAYTAEMIGNTPIVIDNGDGTTITDLTTQIKPEVVGSLNGVVESVDDATITLVSDGGYDNNVDGIYNFEYTGTYRDLEVNGIFQVVVGDVAADYVTAEITTDQDEYTIVQNGFWDPIVVPNPIAHVYDKAGNEIDTAVPVEVDNVDITTVGEYNVGYGFEDTSSYVNDVFAEKFITVHVVAPDAAMDAKVVSTDAEVKLADAPTTKDELIEVMSATAMEADGTNITDQITVTSLGGYDLAAPAVGSYPITFAVTGSNGVIVSHTSTLTIVNDGDTVNSIDMYLNTPVYVELGNGQTASDVVNELILPFVQETVGGVASSAYAIDETTLVSNGGYNNSRAGTYVFTFETTGVETGLVTRRNAQVIVTDDPASIPAIADIDGKDIEILVGDEYTVDNASSLHANSYPQVSAVVTENGLESAPIALDQTNIVSTTFVADTVGEYQTVFSYQDDSTYANPVSSVKALNVSVIDSNPAMNAVISSTDATVEVSLAPTSEAELKETLNVVANEANGTDITSEVTIESLGGYDMSAPTIGSYTIRFAVVGSDGIKVSSTAVLNVVDDGTPASAIEMLLTTPVVVANGSGQSDSDVVNELILPYVYETVDGTTLAPYAVDASTLVSNGGYDNAVNGTYTFKLKTTGTETGLEVEQNAIVIVTDDPASVETVADINGQDITVLQDSEYNPEIATVLHASDYDVVTAEITDGSKVESVPLSGLNVVETNVDTSTAGNYVTTFFYQNDTDYSMPVSVVKPLNVTVEASDPATNAIITATDAEVKLADAPTDVAQIMDILNVSATDIDGTDLTASVETINASGYDYSSPTTGTFQFMFTVIGNDSVSVSTVAKLTVVSDDTIPNAIEMLLATPVVVANGSGQADSDVVNELIKPYVSETVDGTTNSPYAIDETSLVSNGGYDNAVNGTYIFKFVTTGVETGLEVQQTAAVIVTDDPSSVDAIADINGQDITILKDTFYDEDAAVLLHALDYPQVSAVVTEVGTEAGVVELTAANVIETNVLESAVGEYQTTFYFENDTDYAQPVSSVKTLNVSVVDSDESTNAVISGTDTEVNLSSAPTNEAEILALISAVASEANGTDITDQIVINNLDGYNLDSPEVGTYTITISVVGADGVVVSTDVVLSVVDNGAPTNQIEMYVTTPVYVENGNGLTAADVIDTLANPYVVETIDGTTNSPYAVGSDTIISTGGYDNTVDGTYTFKLATVGLDSGLEVEQTVTVIVSSDPSTAAAFATIDGTDLTVLQGSAFSLDTASSLLANDYDSVSAVVTDGTESIVALSADDIISYNVDTSAVGTYNVVYNYEDDTTYSSAVAATRPLTVTVVASDARENAVISGDDTEVNLADAPATEADLLALINAVATEVDGTDITADIKIDDLGGYDLASPTEGDYTITISVVGADGVKVTTTVVLSVISDGMPINEIDMYVTTPIYVENGNGLTAGDIVDTLVHPTVIETVAGTPSMPYTVDSASLVSDGGYDNTVDGTYTFKLKTTGIETSLEVERTVVVVVSSDPSTGGASATIDGQDIKVLTGSYYDPEVAAILHANSYDTTSAVIADNGTESVVSLDGANVVATNVNTATNGTYQTTFEFNDDSTYSNPVTAIDTFDVTVIGEDPVWNAILLADDFQVHVSDAPTSIDELETVMNARAYEMNGTDISNQIKVLTTGGYDITNPIVGDYDITFVVTGMDDVIISKTATLSVVDDSTPIDSIDMLLTSPVVIRKGAPLNTTQVTNSYVKPFIQETIDGVASDAYKVDPSSLTFNEGFTTAIPGKYHFIYEEVGAETGLSIERVATVIVSDDATATEASATIDGHSINVLRDSYYDNTEAVNLHADNYDVVTAVVSQAGSVIDEVSLESTSVIGSDVDTTTLGTYYTTFYFEDDSTYGAPVSATKQLAVNVVDLDPSTNAVITASDAEVNLSDAPITDEELRTLLDAKAYEADGKDITIDIKVEDLGGYDLSSPVVGTYTITFSVVGRDGTKIETEAVLNVIDDGVATDAIEIYGTTPVFVERNNGYTNEDVLTNLVKPFIIENNDGVAIAPQALGIDALVSDGGYDNTVEGVYTYKLQATGTETGLEAEKAIKVYVADDASAIPAEAKIDGQDITVLKGSFYDSNVAANLHANTYPQVTAEVSQSGILVNTDALEQPTDIVFSDVDTALAGDYQTTFYFEDSATYAAPVETASSFNVTVVAGEEAVNAAISATDTEVSLTDAPTTEAQVIEVLSAVANEADGTDISDKIVITDLGGYDLAMPAIGSYPITFAVTGTDGVIVTTTATLTVTEDGTAVNSIELEATSPIVVINGDGTTAAQVIDDIANPIVIETIDGVASAPYTIDSSSIVSSGGYDNNVDGTYTFKLRTTGIETGLEAETNVLVIVTSDIATIPAMAEIDGNDITVLQDSAYTNDLAVGLHANSYPTVTAVVTESGVVTDEVALTASSVIASDVDPAAVGTYSTTFKFTDDSSYAAPVTAITTLAVEVVAADESANAVISGDDTEVNISDMPTDNAGILDLIGAEANEANGTDITDQIVISDLGGLDLSAPTEGDFTIVIQVTGNDGVTVTDEVVITVVSDGDATNSINMLVTTPIVITNGSGEDANAVIDTYANAKVIETIDGTDNSPYSIDSSSIVTTGGYDNNTNGTYTFKLQATGTETNLETEANVVVIVTDDPSSVDHVVIDGNDITILQDSVYTNDLAIGLHANNYDVVTAEVTSDSVIDPVSLTADDVLGTDVDVTTPGTYTTTFGYDDGTLNAVSDLQVTVVAADASTNAVISATDAEVKLSDAPITEEQVMDVLDVHGYEADGTDITPAVELCNLSGYNFTSPETGEFTFLFTVVGSDGVTVTDTATLTVVDDSSAAVNSIEMLVTTPIVITNGSGEDANAVIDTYANAKVTETVGTVTNAPYNVGSETIVSDGGYDNNTNGTYTFKLQATGLETGLEVNSVVIVIVTDDPSSIDHAVIDGQDITVLVDSNYTNDLAAGLHQNNYDVVTAEVTTDSVIETVSLTADDILSSNVDTTTVGTYTTTFGYDNGSVNAVKDLQVTVVDSDESTNAVISGDDTEVNISDIPTDNAGILDLINAQANEANGTDITDQIVIADLGGLDLDAPTEGDFTIVIEVTGEDGVTVTDEVVISVVSDGDATNSIEMLVTNPVILSVGEVTDSSVVVDNYANPMVVETLNTVASTPYSVDSSSLVTDGGFDGNTAGTYTFKLATTGIETGLETEANVLVIVTDDPSSVDHAVIDGQDITVLKGSSYNAEEAVTLHQNNYDVVTAEVTTGSAESPVSLTADDVLAIGGTTDTVGTFTTTFGYDNGSVNAVKDLQVTVVDSDESTNAVISGDDTEVNISDVPTDDAGILDLINAQANEANGTDITDQIVIADLGGLDLSAPTEGDFTIVIEVTGNDGVTVTDEVVISVVSDGDTTNAINLLVTNPVILSVGEETDSSVVVDNYANPMVVETLDTVANTPYSVDSSSLVTDGGFDGNTAGTYTFKLATTGIETGLETEANVLVIVTDDPSSVDHAVIDGSDITVLKGSPYNAEEAVTLHQNNYEVVTAEVTTGSAESPVSLTADNVLAIGGTTDTVGTFTTTFGYDDGTVSTVADFQVTVVDSDESTNAVISGDDTEVNISDVPTDDAGILDLINAQANEANGTDITDQIVIADLGGLDLSAPTEGDFTIVIEVTGNDGVTVSDEVVISVVSDGDAINSIEMLVTNPVILSVGEVTDSSVVVNNYANPMVVETLDTVANAPYSVDSSSLVTDGGFDGNTAGTYTFKLATTGIETGLETEANVLVIVTDDPSSVSAYATIDGTDITVLEGSYYDNSIAVGLHANNYDVVTAEVSELGTVSTVSLTADDVLSSNVDTSATGTYTTTFGFDDSASYAQPVTAIQDLTVTVIGSDSATDAVLSSNDITLNLSDAPTSEEQVISVMHAIATTATGTNITDQIKVADLGGYELSAPVVGTYQITFSVVDPAGTTITNQSTLTIVDDSTDSQTIEMLATTPIVITNGSGEDANAVIDTYANAKVVETIGTVTNAPYNVASETIVSDGGYDNNTNGTYTFKLEATGLETSLVAQTNVVVIVTDDPSSVDHVVIDGQDITVLVDSNYTNDLAAGLHQNNYDVVTAEVTTDSVIETVSLTADDILSTDVDTTTVGTYTTTFGYDNGSVNAVKDLKVTVVDSDESANAVISGDDTEVNISDMPTDNAGILDLINAQANEANGTDITDQIVIADLGGLDLSAPIEGDFTIVIEVTGEDGVTVTDEVVISVVSDGDATNSIEMLVTNPVILSVGEVTDSSVVVDNYINPMVVETLDTVANTPYSVDNSSLVTDGGFDGNTAGTYTFKLATTGIETSLETEANVLVIVTDDASSVNHVVIDGQDITVLKGSAYDANAAVALHQNNYDVVTAEVTTDLANSPVSLTADDVLAIGGTTDTVGTFTTTFGYDDGTVSTVADFQVTVVDSDESTNAVISGDDTEVNISDVPTDNAGILDLIGAEANEANGTDITDQIVISDLGGLDLSAPTEGDFTIVIEVTGNDGVTVTDEVVISVVSDGEATNGINMLVTTPIVITNGSGEDANAVIDTYANAKVIETIDGTDNPPYSIDSSSIVTTGGYDNNTNGTYTFKLQATGTETALETEANVVVIVTDDPSSIENSITIDGQDITVAQDSDYTLNNASRLHALNYDFVTVEDTVDGTMTPVTLGAKDVLASDVDTSVAGVYTTTYYYQDGLQSAVKDLNVTVKALDPSTNAVITANDAEVKLADAPTSEADIIAILNGVAAEANGVEITDKIRVTDLDGYSVESPVVGTYNITLGVTGADGVQITTTVALTVVDNDAPVNSIDILRTSPVYVELGNGLTDSDVIDTLIMPQVVETLDGTAKPAYTIDSSSLVSNGGYDNATKGTYEFKFETTGVDTGLHIETAAKVYVTDDISEIPAFAVIDGNDITVLQGSYYSPLVSSSLHANDFDKVTAEVFESGVETDVPLKRLNVSGSNVNTKTPGVYQTSYYFDNDTDFALEVEATNTFDVTVVAGDESQNAVIAANDQTVNLADAPTTEAELLELLDVHATEADGTDIISSVEIQNVTDYDYDAPAVGEYVFIFTVVGSDGVTVTDTAILTVVDDAAAINSIEMILSDPVYVELGNGMDKLAVTNELIQPQVVETIDGVDNSSYAVEASDLVSAGGYDNNTAGSYLFKYSTTGFETGLNVEGTATVIVTDDTSTIDKYATIDGKDIKVLVGSYYDPNVSTVLHANNYDVVTTEVSESDSVTLFGLDGSNVTATNVDTAAVGTYQTTYYYTDGDVSATEVLEVEVVDTDSSSNAQISGEDTEVNISDVPTDEEGILDLINAEAIEPDGTDKTNDIVIGDLGGLDLDDPAEGDYTIIIEVTGDDGVTVSDEVVITIVSDGEATNDIDMLVTTPVVIELGSGEDANAVVENYIYPTVIETIAKTDNQGYLVSGDTIVSDGGYDNNTAGTYFFKLATTGVETGLEVERFVKVIVTDDPTSIDEFITIDGKDIRLLVGSQYDETNVSELHADNYDVVTAEINQYGAVSPSQLEAVNVVSTDVDVNTVGTYSTIFYYQDDRTRGVDSLVTSTRPLAVEVIDPATASDGLAFTKTVSDRDGDNVASNNDILDYAITISNTSDDIVFENIIVNDDLANSELAIENLSDFKITNSSGEDVTIDYEVNLDSKVNVVIEQLAPNSELTITFSIALDDDITVNVIDNTATASFDGHSKDSNQASIETDYDPTTDGNGGDADGNGGDADGNGGDADGNGGDADGNGEDTDGNSTDGNDNEGDYIDMSLGQTGSIYALVGIFLLIVLGCMVALRRRA